MHQRGKSNQQTLGPGKTFTNKMSEDQALKKLWDWVTLTFDHGRSDQLSAREIADLLDFYEDLCSLVKASYL